MSKVLGNTQKAYIRSSTTYTWLGGEQSNSVNRTAEAIEVSDKSSAWAEFVAGKRGATVEITVYADNEDSGQSTVLASFVEGLSVYWAIGDVGAGGVTNGDSGEAIITSVSDTNDYGAVSSRTISLTATGEVTHTHS